MKSFSLFSLIAFLFTAFNSPSFGQASTNVPVSMATSPGLDRWGRPTPAIGAWTDPALNHNKLLQDQTRDGTYKLIGTYKVIGSSYLFGEHNKGDMFATEAKAYNIFVSYNTYNQEVEFYSTSNPDKPLVKETGTVDSFIIQQNAGQGIVGSMKFIYGAALGVKDKYYFQEICKGQRFSLYKRYKSDLGYSSTNLAQTELRQFDLQIEYYYVDAESKGIKKLKPNAASVIKEFKEIKDLSSEITVDDFSANPEAAFCKAFSSLNQAGKGF
ncbi:MAG: hypothetical protein AAB221_07050 [Bacteroidota bacterium]|mgnify:CR=1 FL=1